MSLRAPVGEDTLQFGMNEARGLGSLIRKRVQSPSCAATTPFGGGWERDEGSITHSTPKRSRTCSPSDWNVAAL